MKPIQRIGKRKSESFVEHLPATDMQKELNALFLESYEKEQQSFQQSLASRIAMDHLKEREDKVFENHFAEGPGAYEITRSLCLCDVGDVVAEVEKDGVVYTSVVGNTSGQPNANGDIIDWSSCSNLSGNKITISDNTGYFKDSGDSIYIGDLTPNKNDKYVMMELPREDVPIAVFVCGRMLTMGILGTDVEVAYTGDKLVFEPGIVGAMVFGDRITVSVEYHDEIYHYNIGTNGMVEYVSENSSTLETTLVSTISKKAGSQITGAR